MIIVATSDDSSYTEEQARLGVYDFLEKNRDASKLDISELKAAIVIPARKV